MFISVDFLRKCKTFVFKAYKARSSYMRGRDWRWIVAGQA